MPITRFDLVLPEDWTTTTLVSFLKQMAAQAGMTSTPAEFTANGERHLVWEVVKDSTKTYGKFYYCLRIDGSDIRQAVAAAFSPPSTLPSSLEWSGSVDLSIFGDRREIEATALRSDEAGLILLRLPSEPGRELFGWVRPQTKAAFWDESSAPYVFCQSFSQYEWISTELNPYREENGEVGLILGKFATNFNDPFAAAANPFNNQVDVLSGVYLYSLFSGGQGIVGVLGSDWGRATDRTLLPGQMIAATNGQQFLVVSPPADFDRGVGVVRTV